MYIQIYIIQEHLEPQIQGVEKKTFQQAFPGLTAASASVETLSS